MIYPHLLVLYTSGATAGLLFSVLQFQNGEGEMFRNVFLNFYRKLFTCL